MSSEDLSLPFCPGTLAARDVCVCLYRQKNQAPTTPADTEPTKTGTTEFHDFEDGDILVFWKKTREIHQKGSKLSKLWPIWLFDLQLLTTLTTLGWFSHVSTCFDTFQDGLDGLDGFEPKTERHWMPWDWFVFMLWSDLISASMYFLQCVSHNTCIELDALNAETMLLTPAILAASWKRSRSKAIISSGKHACRAAWHMRKSSAMEVAVKTVVRFAKWSRMELHGLHGVACGLQMAVLILFKLTPNPSIALTIRKKEEELSWFNFSPIQACASNCFNIERLKRTQRRLKRNYQDKSGAMALPTSSKLLTFGTGCWSPRGSSALSLDQLVIKSSTQKTSKNTWKHKHKQQDSWQTCLTVLQICLKTILEAKSSTLSCNQSAPCHFGRQSQSPESVTPNFGVENPTRQNQPPLHNSREAGRPWQKITRVGHPCKPEGRSRNPWGKKTTKTPSKNLKQPHTHIK